MSTSSENEIPLKVVIDKEKKKVVFAEANSDFTDLLFSYPALLMETILGYVAENYDSSSQPPAIGSFNTLYTSISNPDAAYFATKGCKDMLLNIKNSTQLEDKYKRIEYFICQEPLCTVNSPFAYISTYNNALCKHCGKVLNRRINFKGHKSDQSSEGFIFNPTASFLISDDLYVIPNTLSSAIGIIKNNGITDFGVLEEKTFNIDPEMIVFSLLVYSTLSKTPLTDVFLCKRKTASDILVPTITSKISAINNFKNMTLKVFFQMSTNKIFLAETAEDFIELLFSFLTIPLVSVSCLLDKSYSSLENLCGSILNLDVGRDIISEDIKRMLLHPQWAINYHFNSILLDTTPKFYCESNYDSSSGNHTFYLTFERTSTNGEQVNKELILESPKGDGGILRGKTMFMVTDNLAVTPLSTLSCIKYFKSLKVSPCDIEEQEIDIGLEEALNLLRACLGSTSALTNGLKHLLLEKPNQEN